MTDTCLFTGSIRHRRFAPRPNSFAYRLFMVYVNLDELPGVFDRFWLWSARRPALAWLRRADHMGTAKDLATATRDLVEERTGSRPRGPIRLLTHLRYFGYCFNPVSFYYCFDETDTRLDAIVAEISNTPWGERHCYVLPAKRQRRLHRFEFDKSFHVSPFMPMDIRYAWRFSTPRQRVFVHMENWNDPAGTGVGAKTALVFDATLSLRRRALSSLSLAWALVSFPLMTLQVVTLIHWQALRLWWKRIPFHPHPRTAPAAATPAGTS